MHTARDPRPGRRIAIDGARTYPLRYEYDLAGRLTALIDGEGNRTEWSFDAVGRMTRKTYADGSHYDYTHDIQGRLTSRTDALGKVTSYLYNASGQILLVDYPPAGSGAGDPGDTDIAFTYDALGRLAARTDAAGAWTIGVCVTLVILHKCFAVQMCAYECPLSASFLEISPVCVGIGLGGLCSGPGLIVTQAA